MPGGKKSNFQPLRRSTLASGSRSGQMPSCTRSFVTCARRTRRTDFLTTLFSDCHGHPRPGKHQLISGIRDRTIRTRAARTMQSLSEIFVRLGCDSWPANANVVAQNSCFLSWHQGGGKPKTLKHRASQSLNEIATSLDVLQARDRASRRPSGCMRSQPPGWRFRVHRQSRWAHPPDRHRSSGAAVHKIRQFASATPRYCLRLIDENGASLSLNLSELAGQEHCFDLCRSLTFAAKKR